MGGGASIRARSWAGEAKGRGPGPAAWSLGLQMTSERPGWLERGGAWLPEA